MSPFLFYICDFGDHVTFNLKFYKLRVLSFSNFEHTKEPSINSFFCHNYAFLL